MCIHKSSMHHSSSSLAILLEEEKEVLGSSSSILLRSTGRHHRRNYRSSQPRQHSQNRTLHILAILVLYIIVVHNTLRYVTTFVVPASDNDGVQSKEERLLAQLDVRQQGNDERLRGAAPGVLAFSLGRTVTSSPSSTSPLSMFLKFSKSTKTIFFSIATARLTRWGTRSNKTLFVAANVPNCNSTRVSGQIKDSGIGSMSATDEKLHKDTIHDEQEVNSIFEVQQTNIIIQENNTTIIHNRPRIPILLYCDSYVIASKPPGISVHSNANSHARWGQAKKLPVLESLLKKELCRKLYLVHRLDHRTSGACLFGFTSHAAGRLHGRLCDEKSIKLYVALVRGDLRSKFRCAAKNNDSYGLDMSTFRDGSVIGTRDDIILPSSLSTERIDRGDLGEEWNGKLTVNLPIIDNGATKDARTDFYFLSSMSNMAVTDFNSTSSTLFPNKSTATSVNATNQAVSYITTSLTLLLCRPRSGRKHQIRKHLQKALNAPIIGDVQHGDSRVNRYWRNNIGLDRLALHCWYLDLPPSNRDNFHGNSDDDNGHESEERGDYNEKKIQCIAPLTQDLIDALEKLSSLWSEAILVEPRLGMIPFDNKGGSFGRHYDKQRL